MSGAISRRPSAISGKWPFAIVGLFASLGFGCHASDVDWPSYLGDPGSGQYSALSQINVENVGELELAWTYRSGDVDPEDRSQIQCNPIIVDGVFYGTSPKMKLFALDAATGEELWRFDPFDDDYRLWGLGVNRGVTHWEDRIVYGAGEKLYAVSKDSGEEIFAIDLHVGLGEAFHKESGELLWEVDLPAGGYATPATYSVSGRQYVVIAAGGGKMGTPSGNAYLAFALPEEF